MAERAYRRQFDSEHNPPKTDRIKVDPRVEIGGRDAGSQVLRGTDLAKPGRGSTSTKIAAKGKVKINLEQETEGDQLALRVYEHERLFEKDIKSIDQQTTDKLLEVERLFKGAGFNNLDGNTFENIEVRLDKIIKRSQRGISLISLHR